MDTIHISIKSLESNTGQIEGLPKNPRQWSSADITKIAKSLNETPELFEARPLLVYPQGDKYIILGGNLRFEGAKKNKMPEVPCIVFPEDTPADKLKEIVIKDNGSFGAWDFDMLANEWDNLPLSDWGVPAWDMSDIGNDTAQEDAEDDGFDEDKEEIETRCKRGDIWICGNHRLMCGDSTSETDMAELMDGANADLWLTDPPYNVDYEGGTDEHLKIENDSMNDKDFREFLVKTYKAAFSVLKDGAAFYIWHADSEGYNFRGALYDIGQKCRQCLIWMKNSLVLGRQDYQWQHEPCLYGWKEGGSHKWYSDRKQTTILSFDRPQRSAEHPTMKPIPLFAYQMQNSTKKGDVVLDSFGGSGTTMIAAEQLGRKAYVMELSEHYCDVILARWEKLTGEKAQKV